MKKYTPEWYLYNPEKFRLEDHYSKEEIEYIMERIRNLNGFPDGITNPCHPDYKGGTISEEDFFKREI